jgi:hypothetical protein
MKRLLIAALFSIACAGADGAMGPIGSTGAAGRDGRDGVDGAPGKDGAAATIDSAGYARLAEIAVPRVLELMPAPINGKDGADGARGETGAQGERGEKGEKGDPGSAVVGDSLRLRKLIVEDRLLVGTAVDDPRCPKVDGSEQIIICSNTGASLGFLANANGQWFQNPDAGYSLIGMSPDLGLRLCQNQRWTRDGRHVQYITAKEDYKQTCTGNDSRGTWSWNWHAQGRPDHGTQQMVLDEDESTGTLFFTTWRADRRIGFRTSSFKFAFDQAWIAPTKP